MTINNKFIILGIIYFLSGVANGTEIHYNKIVGLHGKLTERRGVDCCYKGVEEVVNFPIIQLRSPVNVIPLNPSKPEIDETIEIGVKEMQLVITGEEWKLFQKKKEKEAHVTCTPFHSFNGHHHMPVLCQVISIN